MTRKTAVRAKQPTASGDKSGAGDIDLMTAEAMSSSSNAPTHYGEHAVYDSTNTK